MYTKYQIRRTTRHKAVLLEKKKKNNMEKMKDLAYYNGKITSIDDMMIPANDRGFYFGDGIYEAAMVFDYKIYALQDHLDRMFNSAAMLRIELPYTKEEVGALLTDLVQKLESSCQFLYWQVTRGTSPRNHLFPGEGVSSNLYVYSKPWKGVQMSDEYRLISIPDTRFYHCNIKTLNLIPNVMAAQQASEAGCNETVFVRDGYVTECSHSNISMVKDGVFITHPLDNLILPGTERKHIIRWCGEFRGKLYLGFVMTFFSHIFTAIPLVLAAYLVGQLIESQKAGTAFDTSWIWKCIVIQVVLVLLRFLFDYFRARLQEPISYQLTARDRLAIGDALKRVSLGYFQQVSTGNILSSITTGLSTLENMGIRMIDNFIGGYLNFLVIFVCLAVCSPVTALIALTAVALSLGCMLIISHYSRLHSPVEAHANRDMTGAVIEYARGLAVVKSFGKSSDSMDSITQAISDSKKNSSED